MAFGLVTEIGFKYHIEHRYIYKYSSTVFENHRKSPIQHCERNELCLHFEKTKVHQKCQNYGEFLKT